MITFIANHLWQSTVCLVLAALLVRMLGHRAAQWRYRVWLAASLKFLLPFAVLTALGARLPLPGMAPTPTVTVSVAMQAVGEPFGASPDASSPSLAVLARLAALLPPGRTVSFALFGVWSVGTIALIWVRARRRRHLRRLIASSLPVTFGREWTLMEQVRGGLGVRSRVALRLSPAFLEPGVVGVFSPTILWPAALSERLTDEEMAAIFAHELIHVRRRDNLAAAVHDALKTIFWFHPLLWWLESRLLEDRERACDEAVVQLGSEPPTYARSILKVCNFCLQSPLPSVAGVTGANLKQRVEDIMSAQPARPLNVIHRVALGLVVAAVLAGPVVVGAQTGTGHVSGVVTDQSGAPVPGVEVAAVPVDAQAAQKAITDETGRYALDLPPAQYELQARKNGFRVTRAALFVNRGADVQRDLQLNVGGITESVSVGSQAGSNDGRTAADYLELAKQYYEQGKFVEAQRATWAALERLRTASTQAPQPAADPAAGPGPVRVGGDIRPPAKVRHVDPVYPVEAKLAGVSGIVIVDATVGVDGSVRDARVLRGNPMLSEAALGAVQQWVFTPTLVSGAPVEVMMTVTINFTLQ
jgi:TonB family protein